MYASTHADRQDLLQEMVIQLWRGYPKFRGESKFSTWLYRIALNTAITGLRRKRDFIESYEPANMPEQREDKSTEEQEEQLEQLYIAIAQLNDIEKAIVMLYMEDRTYEEMEEILGMSSGALRVKMVRIKDKLRQLTKKD
jgi:RNA polymerase sigma-70 factor (ECF subfamily)